MPLNSYEDLDATQFFFPSEPEVNAKEVQGNILVSFGHPCHHYLFLELTDVTAFRAAFAPWLEQVPSLLEVIEAREKLRSARVDGSPATQAPPVTPAWLHVAFTHEGLRRLGASVDDLSEPLDPAFVSGMAARADGLGDRDVAAPSAWHVGHDGALHALVLIAAHDDPALDQVLARFRGALRGARVLFDLRGQTSVAPPGGSGESNREHFGYAEGRTRPGVLGWFWKSDGDRRAISGRFVARNRREGYPGQRLAHPSRFLTGLSEADPALLRNGSYLVVRLLQQHVGAMHRFVDEAAKATGMSPVEVAARILGRWPHGAPTVRADRDDVDLGQSPCAYYDFNYQQPSQPLGATQAIGDCGREGSDFPVSQGDPQGRVCPFSAHIRKMNPRDDDGSSPSMRALVSYDDSASRVILRRSASYGPASTSTFDAPVADAQGVERGLVFVCYQASIASQFEFLQRGLAMDPNAPRHGVGADALLGQPHEGERTFSLGALADGRMVSCTAREAWVTTRGGGYFFSPSLSILRQLLQ